MYRKKSLRFDPVHRVYQCRVEPTYSLSSLSDKALLVEADRIMRPALALFPLYSRFRSPTTLGPCSACRKSGNKTFQCKQFASLNRCKVAPRIGGESDESLKCNLLKKAAGAGTTWVKNAPTLGRREDGTDKLCTSFLLDSLGGDRELVAHDV